METATKTFQQEKDLMVEMAEKINTRTQYRAEVSRGAFLTVIDPETDRIVILTGDPEDVSLYLTDIGLNAQDILS